MSNPTKLTWQQPPTNTDGSAFDSTQFNGYLLTIDGKPAVSVPIAWDEDRSYEMPIAPLGLSFAAHTVTMQTVHKNGSISAPSNTASFTLKDERVPQAPLALSAA